MTSQFIVFAFQRFGYHVSVEHDEKHRINANLVEIGSWWPEIWPHEYLISPIEISVNWAWFITGMNQGQFTLISMGLIRYSCAHISGHHEPIHVKFGM